MTLAPDAGLLRVDCWCAKAGKMPGERHCCHYQKVELRTDENCNNPDQTEG
jgi:hypothetical protein